MGVSRSRHRIVRSQRLYCSWPSWLIRIISSELYADRIARSFQLVKPEKSCQLVDTPGTPGNVIAGSTDAFLFPKLPKLVHVANPATLSYDGKEER
jgi:hypothetical protein